MATEVVVRAEERASAAVRVAERAAVVMEVAVQQVEDMLQMALVEVAVDL